MQATVAKAIPAQAPVMLHQQQPQISKKDRLSTGPHCLPRQKEIVLHTANIMAPNVIPKQKDSNGIAIYVVLA
jgi:hypothetical protein